MKVAVVTQYFPTSTEPWAGHSAYQTLRQLALHCDLHVFYPEAVYPDLLTPRAAKVRLDPTWSPPDVRVTYMSYPVVPVISRPLNGFTMAKRLQKAVKNFAPDIILSYVVYPDGYAALRIGDSLSRPVVLKAIGSDLNRMPDRLVSALTRSALRRADAITTVSHDLARTAVAMGARSTMTTTILNGCDTSVFKPTMRLQERLSLGLDPEAEVVLYVGRLDLRKGLAELIESVANLAPRRPRLRAYLVGDGPDRPALEEQIAAAHMRSIIRLIPACSTIEVAQWMSAADLVTLPSYMEGCPNVVLEALSAGRPVVATRVGGIPELLDDRSGRLVPPRDPVALASALEEVLLATWNADEISARHGRSWKDVSEDLLNVIKGTLLLERVRA